MPIGPLYLWFGVIGFWATLLYGVVWGRWPFKGKVHPWGMMAISFIIVMVVSILIWNLLTNLEGTPIADTPINHKGPLNVNWLTGYLVWSIAWFFVFSPVFTTQGSPFGKWVTLALPLVRRFLLHLLGTSSGRKFSLWNESHFLFCWKWDHLSSSGHWFIPGISSSGESQNTPLLKEPLAFIVQCILIFIWVIIVRLILGPAGRRLSLPNFG